MRMLLLLGEIRIWEDETEFKLPILLIIALKPRAHAENGSLMFVSHSYLGHAPLHNPSPRRSKFPSILTSVELHHPLNAPAQPNASSAPPNRSQWASPTFSLQSSTAFRTPRPTPNLLPPAARRRPTRPHPEPTRRAAARPM